MKSSLRAFSFGGELKNPTAYQANATGLSELLGNVVGAITAVAGLLLFVYLVFGGFKYITAGGDDKAIQEAKKMIMSAIVGLGIVVTAYMIARVAGTVLGIDYILGPIFKGP
jgi:hypothetical protein